MKALLSNYHQSPRKVRLVADLIRGKNIAQAKTALMFMTQKSSPALLKLLNSAVSNATTQGMAVESLFVKTIAVNKGIAMRRFKPMGRGRSAQFRKTMSIVTLELGSKDGAAVARLTAAKADKATKPAASAKKTVAVKKVAAKKVPARKTPAKTAKTA